MSDPPRPRPEAARCEAVKLYTEFGYPALQKGGQDKKLIGYFQGDTGMINELAQL